MIFKTFIFEKRVMMNESHNDRIHGSTFVKNAILDPKANIKSDAHMSVKDNIGIFLFLLLVMHFIGTVNNFV